MHERHGVSCRVAAHLHMTWCACPCPCPCRVSRNEIHGLSLPSSPRLRAAATCAAVLYVVYVCSVMWREMLFASLWLFAVLRADFLLCFGACCVRVSVAVAIAIAIASLYMHVCSISTVC